jgi:hypothetical protein
MDPISTLGQQKTLDVLDEEARRERELNDIVARARKLRPKKRYPTAKPKLKTADISNAGTWGTPASAAAAARASVWEHTPPAAADVIKPIPNATPGMNLQDHVQPIPNAAAGQNLQDQIKPLGRAQPPGPEGVVESSGGPGGTPAPMEQFTTPPGPEGVVEGYGGPKGVPAPKEQYATPTPGIGQMLGKIGPMLGQGGQSVANFLGPQAGKWYSKLPEFMQQYGLPIGGPLLAMLAGLLLKRLFSGGGQERLYKTSAQSGMETGSNADIWPLLLAAGAGSTAGGAAMGAGAGSVLGLGAGAARGNVPEGVGRGLIRGGMAGGGAALGGMTAPLLLAMLSKQLTGKDVDPGYLPAASLAGAGLGGLGGYGASGSLLGPPEAEREERSVLRKAANAMCGVKQDEDKYGADAWRSVPGGMPGVNNFAPYETSSSRV